MMLNEKSNNGAAGERTDQLHQNSEGNNTKCPQG